MLDEDHTHFTKYFWILVALHYWHLLCGLDWTRDPQGVEESPPPTENSDTMPLAQPRVCGEYISKQCPHLVG